MKISTRNRAIILALTIATVFFIFRGINFVELLNIEFEFDFVKVFIIAIIMYFGTYWVLNFKVRGERFITILLFPSLTVFILTLYVDLIIDSILGSVNRLSSELIASLLVGFVAYILVLTVNILNIGHIQKIPLTQAGRAAHYILTLISTYLFYSIIFNNSLSVFIKLGVIFALTYIFTSIALWTIELRFDKRVIASIATAICITVFALVLLIWPIDSEYQAFALSIVYYMILGIALEIREVLSNRIWLEYTFLYIVIIAILLLVSDWGINGQIV